MRKKINWLSNFMFVYLLCFLISLYDLHAMTGEDQPDEHPCLRIFAGYDRRAPIGYHICEQSILKHTSRPVAMTPLVLSSLNGTFTRERAPEQLSDFTYSRFMVPHYSDYKGWSLFMDGSDMMVRQDITSLFELRDDRYAVMVVKHPDFSGSHSFMGNSVQAYPMLNWSSVMLFNNRKCNALSPKYVNTAGYYDLHQFKWLEDESQIGELPVCWNHLVTYYEPNPEAAIVHWTTGAPFQGGDFAKAEHTDEWHAYRDNLFPVAK